MSMSIDGPPKAVWERVPWKANSRIPNNQQTKQVGTFTFLFKLSKCSQYRGWTPPEKCQLIIGSLESLCACLPVCQELRWLWSWSLRTNHHFCICSGKRETMGYCHSWRCIKSQHLPQSRLAVRSNCLPFPLHQRHTVCVACNWLCYP